ncbi:MAG: SPOR domain-containing protein [gamma proteobacterium endosymbiont of Lamellibrachia anaximandri]|nr:SPOR domain-containing protein [gamma proteobacterium endosymbiont of Lamellibrachia anaximandri]MBL3619364.1 SPOR domain-containing protein [gamma proteobacterium endosymbiont of Lamellibrachia anaximandri]
MALKKTSKKDLQTKLDQLKERVETITMRLDRQSYAHSKLKGKVKYLWRDASDLLGVRASLQSQLQGLADANEGLPYKCRLLQEADDRLEQQQTDLAQTLSSIQQQLDALQRDNDLGGESASQGQRPQELVQVTEGLAAKLHDLEVSTSLVERAGDELETRVNTLESSASEILKRQQELDELAHGLNDHVEVLPALQEHLDKLTSDLNTLWDNADGMGVSLKQQTHITTLLGQSRDDLADRTGALENELRTLAEQQSQHLSPLSDKMARFQKALDHLSSQHQDLLTSGNDTRLHDLEETTLRMERAGDEIQARTETLESSAVELSIQLQAMERQLSELVGGAGSPKSDKVELDDLYRSFEQQLNGLKSEQSANHSLLEEFLSRTGDLEKAAVTQTEHTDIFSNRLATLTEELHGLLALETDRRLDDLDMRNNTLEQSLQGERGRISELEQVGVSLNEQLNSAVTDTGALEERINTLGTGSERLNNEIDRLDGEFQVLNRSMQEQLHAHDARLLEQQQQLDDVVVLYSKPTDNINSRLNGLDNAHQALQVQQAQQNDETQGLKQRSLLLMMLLLLITATVGFLLFRDSTTPEEPQQVDKAESVVISEPATDSTKLENEVAELRQGLSQLGDSVAQVTRSVDEIKANVDPELLGKVNRLADNLEALSQESLQKQQESARLKTSQQQVQAELDKITGKVKALERIIPNLMVMAAAQTPEGLQWMKAQQLGQYTLQVVGVHKRESLARFVRQQGIEADSAIYHTEHQGQKWYVLFYGNYETLEQAKAATRQLPADLAAYKPWIRRIPETGGLFPL